MKSLTLPRLIVAITFVSLFAMAVRTPVDSDMWWHLRTGQFIVETRTIPFSDPFSHTKTGQPWIDVYWLAQIALYAVYAIASYPGLAIVVALLVLAAFVFVWKQMEGGRFLKAFVLILAAITSAVIWSPRPQMLTFTLTAILGYVVYLYKWRQIDRLWLLPPMFVLWANLHGGFAVGFILLGAAISGEVLNRVLKHDGPEVLSWPRLRRLVVVTALSFALLAINPYTTAMYTFPLRTVGIGVLRDFIQEWSSPDFHQLFAQPFIWMLIATLAAVGWSGRRLDGGDFALLAAFAYSALLARRNIAPFALVCAPILARHAQAAIERLGWGRQLRQRTLDPPPTVVVAANGIILIVVLLLAGVKIVAPLLPPIWDDAERRIHPRDAVDWIESGRPAGLMFNAYNWGGYLIWRLWPEYPVYVDGRTDLYDDAFLRDYLAVAGAQPGFESILDRDRIGWVLIEVNSPLDLALSRSAGWQEVYRDDMAAIFIRSASASGNALYNGRAAR